MVQITEQLNAHEFKTSTEKVFLHTSTFRLFNRAQCDGSAPIQLTTILFQSHQFYHILTRQVISTHKPDRIDYLFNIILSLISIFY